MVDRIVTFIFVSKSPLWVTIGIYKSGWLKSLFWVHFLAQSSGNVQKNKSEQFHHLKEKMGLILKKSNGLALTTSNLYITQNYAIEVTDINVLTVFVVKFKIRMRNRNGKALAIHRNQRNTRKEEIW